MSQPHERAQKLLSLHTQATPLVLPTVWDAWSASFAEEAGFSALTVGSHPLADSRGQQDGESMSLQEALDGVASIVRAVEVPVSADLESGYDTPAGELVDRLLESGAVGLNIEDTVHSEGRLRSAQEHADYIGAIRQAADESGVHVVINGRTDVFKSQEHIGDRLEEALTRLNLLEEAGADSLYPVALPDGATLRAILAGVSTPVNVTAHPVNGAIPEGLGLEELSTLGVRRVTFGPLLQAALADTARELLGRWS